MSLLWNYDSDENKYHQDHHSHYVSHVLFFWNQLYIWLFIYTKGIKKNWLFRRKNAESQLRVYTEHT